MEQTILYPHGMSAQERQFLDGYDLSKYDRPSVTTDIAVFSLQTKQATFYKRSPEQRLSILLVRRGEYPFKDRWALPGGFLKNGETVADCAYREIREETSFTPVALFPIGVFSEPNRDPRGWILSHAFASIVSENDTAVSPGDDAAETRWFDVEFCAAENKAYRLTLTGGDTVLTAAVREQSTRLGDQDFAVVHSPDLAFDHAAIIASALSRLRKEAESFDIIFDFLPETFTLNALQKVQETLMGISQLSANFRRKAAEYVEETDQFTTGAGHRPARLFKRKNASPKGDTI